MLIRVIRYFELDKNSTNSNLERKYRAKNQTCNIILLMIVMTFRTQLVHWLREHGLNLKLAVSAAWLYSLQPELLPDLPQVPLF